MANQFRIGQLVRLRHGRFPGRGYDGEYKVLRQLPERNGEPQYRLKNVHEPHERVAMQSDLEKA